jgi:hypothetical protein
VWAAQQGTATITTVVLNKQDVGELAAVIRPSEPCAAGAFADLVTLVSGPGGLGAFNGSTYANMSFDGTTDGIPVGTRAVTQVACVGGSFSVTVPAASGAFLTYHL